MLEINDSLSIPDDELQWKFARSGGPGGQNVNKVESKALLTWDMPANTSVPAEIKARLRAQQRRFVTKEGLVLVVSQKTRDQDKNRADCLDKLRTMLVQAAVAPKKRKKTRPTRGSKMARLADKKHQASRKASRRTHADD